ncbi:hypothetical protein ABH931_000978 [Streptacidiphilus sp. MAP12-33]|uniref:hypothetical protein n=1 Tax=Streptacidiphilus sp. MAP12-33 TaxID=3156266 RepID=UPI003512AE55
MDEELVTLASLAATTVVKAAAGDLWGRAKELAGRVLRRPGAEGEIEPIRAELVAAGESGDKEVGLRVAQELTERFQQALLADRAVVEVLLRELAALRETAGTTVTMTVNGDPATVVQANQLTGLVINHAPRPSTG